VKTTVKIMHITCPVNNDMLESNSINCAEQAANNGRKQTDRRSPNRNGASSQRLYYCQTQQTPYTRQDLQHRLSRSNFKKHGSPTARAPSFFFLPSSQRTLRSPPVPSGTYTRGVCLQFYNCFAFQRVRTLKSKKIKLQWGWFK
jgi:hypothetical protein